MCSFYQLCNGTDVPWKSMGETSEGNCWSSSPVIKTQIKNSDLLDNQVVLSNCIVAKSSCPWHVRRDAKLQCTYWVPELERWCSWIRKKKKNPCWSLPSSSIFEVRVSIQCPSRPSAVPRHRALILPPVSVPSTQRTATVGISYGGSVNSRADLPFLWTSAKGRAAGNRADRGR